MMAMGIGKILGKCIRSVIVSRRKKEPRVQLFLIFDDDTHYEFYGDLTGAGHVREGGEDEVALYIESFEGEAVFYGDPARSEKGLATRGKRPTAAATSPRLVREDTGEEVGPEELLADFRAELNRGKP